MKFSKIGRIGLALAASVALGLSMTACGGGTIGYLWVVGTNSNSAPTGSIAGFKIDDYTGNLTTIPKSPFTSGGSNPANILVRPGGRFVYVVNKGSGTTTTTTNGVTTTTLNRDGNIAEFSVGGDGTLTFQQNFSSQGGTPVWAEMDSSGSYLYVLDSLAPAGSTYAAAGLGEITVFAIAGDTGRLSVVQNQQVRDASNNNLLYFPVGPSPTTMRLSASSCLYVVDKNQSSDAYQTYLYPYQIGSGGQLTQTLTSQISTGATYLSSVNVGGGNGTGTSIGGTYILATDVGPMSGGNPTTPGNLYQYTTGSNCALAAVTGSPYSLAGLSGGTQIATARYPVWAQTESRGNLVYVLNLTNSNTTQANSSISVLTVSGTNGQLQALSDTNNPYTVGSGPVCVAEDPTSQYIYTANSTDGTVTGKAVNVTQGPLTDLARGSKFSALTHASCLAVSNSTN